MDQVITSVLPEGLEGWTWRQRYMLPCSLLHVLILKHSSLASASIAELVLGVLYSSFRLVKSNASLLVYTTNRLKPHSSSDHKPSISLRLSNTTSFLMLITLLIPMLIL